MIMKDLDVMKSLQNCGDNSYQKIEFYIVERKITSGKWVKLDLVDLVQSYMLILDQMKKELKCQEEI